MTDTRLPHPGEYADPQPAAVDVASDPPYDLIEAAWVILANVSEGDWTKQPQEWQDAVAGWRDEYHRHLVRQTKPEADERRGGYSQEDRVRLWRGMGNVPWTLPDYLSDADLDAMVARFTSNA